MSIDEFNKLKRKEARNSAVLKAIVRKLKKEDAEMASFPFPLEEMADFKKLTDCLGKNRLTDELVRNF